MIFTITIDSEDPRAQERVEQAMHVLATQVRWRQGYRVKVELAGPDGLIRGFTQGPVMGDEISSICMEGWHADCTGTVDSADGVVVSSCHCHSTMAEP